jgi:hypothetical protein
MKSTDVILLLAVFFAGFGVGAPMMWICCAMSNIHLAR